MLLAEFDYLNASIAIIGILISSTIVYILARRADNKQDTERRLKEAINTGELHMTIAQLKQDIEETKRVAKNVNSTETILNAFLKRFEMFEQDVKEWLKSLTNDLKEVIRNPNHNCGQVHRLAQIETRQQIIIERLDKIEK